MNKKSYVAIVILFLGLSSCVLFHLTAQGKAQLLIDVLWDGKINEAKSLYSTDDLSDAYLQELSDIVRMCNQKPVASIDHIASESVQFFNVYLGTDEVGSVTMRLIDKEWYVSSAGFNGCLE